MSRSTTDNDMKYLLAWLRDAPTEAESISLDQHLALYKCMNLGMRRYDGEETKHDIHQDWQAVLQSR